MASYSIQAPNGKTYTIDGPDGASQDDVQQEVMRQFPEAAGGAHRPQSLDTNGQGQVVGATGSPAAVAQQQPTAGMSTGAMVAAGAGKAVMDAGRGLQQMGNSVADAVSPQAQTMSGMVTGASTKRSDTSGLNEDIRQSRANDKALEATNAGKAGEILGQLAMTYAAPGGALGSAVAGAAQGAATPTLGNESRATNTATGAALGFGGHVAGTLLGKVVGGLTQPFRSTMTDDMASQAQDLLNSGVPLSAAQQGGGKIAQTLHNVVSDNPLIGSSLSAEQQSAFTSAVLKTVGIQSDTASPKVMDTLRGTLGNIFDTTAARNPIPMDNTLLTRLATVETAAGSELGPNEMSIIQKQVDNLIDHAAAGGGTLNGQAFANARSSLARLQGQNDVTGHWAGEIHDALADALNRNVSPQEAQTISTARGAYRAMKAIQDSITSTNDISPVLLYNRLDRLNNVNQMVYGKGDQSLVGLATAGKNILGGLKTPNSGTGQRIAGMLMTGSALSAVDALAGGDPKQAMEAGLLGVAGPNIAKVISENPASARIIGQWARSKVLGNFRKTVTTGGAALFGSVGGAITPQVLADEQEGDNGGNQ